MTTTPRERIDHILKRLRTPQGYLAGEGIALWAIQELTLVVQDLLPKTPPIKEPRLGKQRNRK